MEPATPDELDQIIRDLMHDQGPPLLVSDDRGVVHQAGTRVPSSQLWGRFAQGANNADEVKLRWEELRHEVNQARDKLPPRHTVEHPGRLAGDVFHGELERMDLKAAIAKAINEGRDTEVKRIAAEAIAKAVRGQTSQAGDSS